VHWSPSLHHRSGYAGLGPAELKPYYLNWILSGGHMLYILRPVPGTAHPSTFKLVSDCDVQGVMDGEAFEGRENDFPDVYIV